ncbi:MAG: AbrB/MazE/SpoVT family DNA-binding domain-containing protein [Candidatus Magasanikbacteria bacterium]
MKKETEETKDEFFGNIHGTTSVGERGQLVIPKKLREKLKIKKADNFVVMEKHGMVVLVPAKIMTDFISKINLQLNNINKK